MFLELCSTIKTLIGESWALGGFGGVGLTAAILMFGSFFPVSIGFWCWCLIYTAADGSPRPFRWSSVCCIVFLMSLAGMYILLYPEDKELIGFHLAHGDLYRATLRGAAWVTSLAQFVLVFCILVLPDDETLPDPSSSADSKADAVLVSVIVTVGTACKV